MFPQQACGRSAASKCKDSTLSLERDVEFQQLGRTPARISSILRTQLDFEEKPAATPIPIHVADWYDRALGCGSNCRKLEIARDATIRWIRLGIIASRWARQTSAPWT